MRGHDIARGQTLPPVVWERSCGAELVILKDASWTQGALLHQLRNKKRLKLPILSDCVCNSDLLHYDLHFKGEHTLGDFSKNVIVGNTIIFFFKLA